MLYTSSVSLFLLMAAGIGALITTCQLFHKRRKKVSLYFEGLGKLLSISLYLGGEILTNL